MQNACGPETTVSVTADRCGKKPRTREKMTSESRMARGLLLPELIGKESG
jgi:hypothetical protein